MVPSSSSRLACSLTWTYKRDSSAWTRLSWILGLERVDVQVLVVDQIDLRRCSFAPGEERVYENALNVGSVDDVVEELASPDARRPPHRPATPTSPGEPDTPLSP